MRLSPQWVDPIWALGNLLYQKDRNPEAAEWIEQAVALEPDNPHLYCLLGSIYFQMEKEEDCVKALEKALELDPEHTLSHFAMGMYYLSRFKLVRTGKELYQTLKGLLKPEKPK